MQKLIVGLKREYWEHKRIDLGIPLLLSIIIVTASVIATFWGQLETSVSQSSLDNIPFEFIEIYIDVAWLTGFFYLLQCLHHDRKDKSILYWKSVPVSETRNVLTKLLFGTIGMALIAIVIAWAVYLVLLALGLGTLQGSEDGEGLRYGERIFSATKLFIWPLLGLVLGVVLGAPIFGYLLMVSAISKRSPFLLMALPLLVLGLFEHYILRTNYLSAFVGDHMPFAVFDGMKNVNSIGEVMNLFFVNNGVTILFGILVGVITIYCAIWCRNHRFEI